jgi:hypothetical protein
MDKRNRCSHAGLQGPYGIRTRPVSRSPFRDLSSGGQIPTSGAEREKQKPPFAAGFCDGRYWARAAVRVSSLGQQG